MSKPAAFTLNLDFTRLPPAPHILINLIDLCHRADTGIDELEAVIKLDAALCAKIMTIANSADYRQHGDMHDLKRILFVVGVPAIKSIALTSAVHQFFSQFNEKLGATLGSLWLDALICAHLTRGLAERTGYGHTEEAHLAGLLHQLGQLILLSHDGDHFQAMLTSATDQQALLLLERQRYGRSSVEVAADLLDAWHFDAPVADAVRYQHQAVELMLDTHPLIKLLKLSSRLCNRLNPAAQKSAIEDPFFGLEQSSLEQLLADATCDAIAEARDFGIEVNDKDMPPTANIDDEATRLSLARKVRQIALLEGVQQDFSALNEHSEMEQRVRENLHMLFGLPAAIFFQPDSEQAVLSGSVKQHSNHPAAQFSVQIEPQRSLLAVAAAQHRTIISSQQDVFEEIPVIDQQIRSALASAEFISLPLVNRERLMGVIAIGCSSEQAEQVHNDHELFDHFACIIAGSYARQQQIAHEQHQQLEQKQLELNLQTRKIIHEVNNPLTIINNYLEILSIDINSDSDNRQHLETIKSEVDRVGEILLQLKDQQMQSNIDHPQVDVNKLIDRLIDIYKPTFYKQNNIKSILELDPSLPKISTDQNRLKQIITNLIKNAVEALSDDGVITIKTRALVAVNKKRFIEINIADNGPGIDQPMLDKLFYPVQSEKGSHHSGLGLTIVYKLVSELMGQISYSSSASGGAEFSILIPRTEL